jgi:xanthine dehydrogenase accessory factor
MTRDTFELEAELRASRQPFAVATVIETRGSVSAKTSSKAVVDDRGRVLTGWVGGGCAESAVCQAALQCISSGETTVVDIDLDDEVLGAGMPCGGHMRVYVEPVLPRPMLWILGHGRIAEVLCTMADLVGLEVAVVDPLADPQRFPAASRLISDDFDYAQLTPLAGDFVVIASQHKGDHRSMQRALATDARYIALIASKKRSRLVLDELRRASVSDEDLARVSAPSGLDLGAQTPEEVALCLVSEMVLVRRGGSGLRMCDKPRNSRETPSLKAAGA